MSESKLHAGTLGVPAEEWRDPAEASQPLADHAELGVDGIGEF